MSRTDALLRLKHHTGDEHTARKKSNRKGSHVSCSAPMQSILENINASEIG